MIRSSKQVRLVVPAMHWPSPVALLLIALLAAGVVPPFVFLALSSLHEIDATGGLGAFTFDHFIAIFSSRAFGPTLRNSALYSLGSALLALLIGAMQAWLAERTDPPFPPFLFFAPVVSPGIPFVL